MPKIELFYGYVTSENGDVYHAFEALDPERDSAEDDAVVSDLAALLDTTSDAPDFNGASMYIELPASLVKAIQDGAAK